MKKDRHIYCKILFLLWLPLFLSSCKNRQGEETVARDFAEIKESGEITAVTLYSSTSYFQYKMQPMGYEYELIQDFAQSNGLKLNIKVAENQHRLIDFLKSGEADVVAFPIPINNRFKQELIFCGHEEIDNQVLVQRTGKTDTLLTDVTQLIGKDIYVKSGTKYSDRLKNLNAELGGGIRIHPIEADSITVEDLIEKVSRGEIAYTVCDEKMARLNKTYFWNLNISLKISFPQRSSWVVRKNSPQLAQAIQSWASDKAGKRTFRAAAKRYFELGKQPFSGELPEIKDGHISPFDDLFRKHAQTLGWDWQLLASIAYQESRFNPNVVSWAGAEGLMGIMPNTARALDILPHELKDPDTGIKAGVDCLRRFRQGFSDIEDPSEKIKFTLASYNAGIGHIYDAQRLAKKYGKNDKIWDHNVADFILLKKDSVYYNDPVCKHGYLRGSETFNYVRDVMAHYLYYKEKTR